ncbi:CBY1-interacting BAR domain-containing protein 2-like isoform X2 [Melanotaenia boesemani]|uniref:CBY1-interacting BAR domain-containing protein 2-like isoform X2 n=1 Tax=Melanotaenia boesemani TaxID=1250792 RepID=UPI001C049981|nr:CBY1-interacting BAR domain-containing protein 2-like isoform X2 [Melanotaenia boesemani]
MDRNETQMKNMEQTIKHAEKNLGEMCSLLASYARKTAKLRDKADLLVAQLFDFSSTEGPELQTGLKHLAEDMAMVQDYRQAQVERLETRVVAPLKDYGDIVKNKKTHLKKLIVDLNKEQKELQKLEKIRLKNPADGQSISQAELLAQKASTNAQRSIRQLEETITDFQRQKLEDVKKIFTDFITVEMVFHAKALEVYSHTYHSLEDVDTQKDLELFISRITTSESHAVNLDSPLSNHFSPLRNHFSSSHLASSKSQGLSSVQTSTAGQSHRQRHSHFKDVARRFHSTLKHQRGVEAELEPQEEDEDEEEEEEEDDEEEEEQEESELEMEKSGHASRQSYATRYALLHR